MVAYVLLTRERQSRQRLAALLWGGAGQRLELGSLRVALTKLPAEVVACLQVTRDAIGPAPGAPCEVDVDAFVAECASESVDSLERAVARYTGELLQSVPVETAPEFSDWLLAERTRLRELAHGAHARLAQRLHAQGEPARARAVADAWLRQDPASESMHRLLMTWLAQGGGSDQALAHYEVYRRARAVAHGAAPSEEMAALADRLRQGREQAAMRDQPARITAATAFFGRTDELAELRALLSDPACRLLTLHGLGGVGKTRLAVAIADLEAAAFPGGVHVVALDGLLNPRLFAQTLARGCGLQPAGSADPLELVASFLRDRPALLVIDNLEHLLDEPDDDPRSVPAQVATLLRTTGPRLKILATSRAPLRLQEEWLYALEGLSYPVNGAGADAQGFAAVQFFAQRARQSYMGFSLAAELPNVVQICSLLEGLPLGLELAASWVRNVPCSEIAASLASRAAELRSFHVNRAARHTSLGAVVAYSWERLPAEQREALEGLACLVGSFSREAAESVAHAGVRTLSALTEKSLLQPAGPGRWRMHEVVRQYAWEQPGAVSRSRPARQAAVLKRRDAFFLEFLRDARGPLAGEAEAETIARMELEAPNIRAAWQAFARGQDAAALDTAAPPWFEFLECRCFFAECLDAAEQWLQAGEAAGAPLSAERARTMKGIFQRFCGHNAAALESLQRAAAALEKLEAPAERVQARTALAFTLLLLGRLEEAEAECTRALAAAEALGDAAAIAAACRTRGLIALHGGKREAARDLERRALELALSTGKPSLRASAHNNLAMAENHLGNYSAAQAGYESALGLWRDLQATANIGRAMHNLGVVATRAGDHSTALERYRAALEVLRKAGDRNLIALNLMSTGDALVRLGRAVEAREPLESALTMAQRDGNMLPALDARVVLAQAAIATGDAHAAAEQLAATFEAAGKHHFRNVLGDALVTAARLLLLVDPASPERPLEWSATVAKSEDLAETVRRDARELIDHLREASRAAPAGGKLDERVDEARAAVERIRLLRAKAGSESGIPAR